MNDAKVLPCIVQCIYAPIFILRPSDLSFFLLAAWLLCDSVYDALRATLSFMVLCGSVFSFWFCLLSVSQKDLKKPATGNGSPFVCVLTSHFDGTLKTKKKQKLWKRFVQQHNFGYKETKPRADGILLNISHVTYTHTGQCLFVCVALKIHHKFFSFDIFVIFFLLYKHKKLYSPCCQLQRLVLIWKIK